MRGRTWVCVCALANGKAGFAGATRASGPQISALAASFQCVHPRGEGRGVVGPRAECPGAGGVGERGKFSRRVEQSADGGSQVGDVDGGQRDAATVAGGFAEGAAGGADAGFAVGETFDDGQAEAFDQ